MTHPTRLPRLLFALIVLVVPPACGGSDGAECPPVADTDAAIGLDTTPDTFIEPITLDLDPDCNPFATSNECFLPFPSAFYQQPDPDSPTGVRVNIPQAAIPVDPGAPTISVDPINTADGCSPAGPILAHFGVDIEPVQLTRQGELLESLGTGHPIALFDLETGRRLFFMSEMDMNRDTAYPDRYALIIRPMEPMEMGHRHVAVLTKALRDDQDNGFESPPAFAALRDGVPTTNPVIEDVRTRFETIFEFLAKQGYPRDDLLLAWDFMVASEDYLTGSVRSMRAEALPEVAGKGLGYTVDEVTLDPNENTASLVKGTFEVPTFLNAKNSFEYDADHHPVRQAEDQSFPFTLLIPKKARTLDEPLPLIVFGHGLFGTGEGAIAGGSLGYMSALAEDGGMVMIATDWIGLSGGDLQLIITEVVPDLNRIAFITDRIQQSIINTLTLTELAVGTLSSDPALQVGQGELIDDSRVYYVGGSLGGIQGSSFVSMSPRITRAVLAVPGCGWLNMLTRSTHWNNLSPVVDAHYPDPLLKQIGIALIQALFDLSDPVNLTRHLYENPLPDAPDERVLLLQVAIGDSQVPNLAFDMLARAIGAKFMEPSVYQVPGLDVVTSPTREPVLVQIYMRDEVEADPPPEENVPPQSDNGVHGAASFLDHVMAQSFHFLHEGEVVQNCTGACDPD